MDQAGVWRLAPAYDLTYAIAPGGEHHMDVGGGAHVASLGLRHGISDRGIDEMVEAVRHAVASWPAFAAASGVGRDSSREVSEAIEAVGRRFTETFPRERAEALDLPAHNRPVRSLAREGKPRW